MDFNGAPYDKYFELFYNLFDEVRDRELFHMEYTNALSKELIKDPSLKMLFPSINISPYVI